MTIQSVADALGVDRATVSRHAADMGLTQNGKQTLLNERQATEIKRRIERSGRNDLRNVAKVSEITTELEENETILHAVSILQRCSEEYKKRAEAAEARNATLEPKGDAYDALMSGDGTYSVKEVAKMLHIKGVGQNNLFKILRERKYLMTNNLPYQNYVEQGLFVVKAITTPIKGKNVNMTITRITPKGLDWLRKDLGEKIA